MKILQHLADYCHKISNTAKKVSELRNSPSNSTGLFALLLSTNILP